MRFRRFYFVSQRQVSAEGLKIRKHCKQKTKNKNADFTRIHQFLKSQYLVDYFKDCYLKLLFTKAVG